MDLYICFEAPRSDDFLRWPRLADKAAPAACCCFLDLAGIVQATKATRHAISIGWKPNRAWEYFRWLTARPGMAEVAVMRRQAELEVAGRKVAVSNLEKVLYPEAGFTKANVLDYYIRISPVLLPHLKDRPLSLKRYPDGVEGGFFYEKRCPPYRPEWVQTAPVWSERSESEIRYCMANDLPSIVWAANLGDLELHTFLA